MRLSYSHFWLPRVVNKITLYLAFLGALVLFLYGLGNAQHFLDSTQFFLLTLFTRIGILYLVAAFYSVVLILLAGIKGNKMHWGRLSLSLFGMIIMGVLYLLVNLVLIWAR